MQANQIKAGIGAAIEFAKERICYGLDVLNLETGFEPSCDPSRLEALAQGPRSFHQFYLGRIANLGASSSTLSLE